MTLKWSESLDVGPPVDGKYWTAVWIGRDGQRLLMLEGYFERSDGTWFTMWELLPHGDWNQVWSSDAFLDLPEDTEPMHQHEEIARLIMSTVSAAGDIDIALTVRGAQ